MLGRLQKTDISDGSSIAYTYDKQNQATAIRYNYNGQSKYTTYNYFKGGTAGDTEYPNGAKKSRDLNAHAQVRPSWLTTPTGKVWSINRQYYTPTIGGVTYTTGVMGNLIYESIGRTFKYSYDGSGNISQIIDERSGNQTTNTYQYDEANQLIRENNAATGKTVTYTYDAGGNILTRTEYPFTTGSLDGLTGTVVQYTYGDSEWKDLLTAFEGNAITYDEIGNPLTYYNGTQFTWNYGRKLASATTADGKNISYKYNDSGIRTSKTVDGVKTEYFLNGSTIVAEKTGSNVIWYYFDGDGSREAIEYNGKVYYYFYNAQGDVVGLFDDNLNVVVEYTYDSWGNTVSITGSLADTLGRDNHFRYRGYYYDSETNLYYLNSRYYDANTGRFVNADRVVSGTASLQGYNLFSYCFNNPINLSDKNGNWPDWVEKAVDWVEEKVINPVKRGITYVSGKIKGRMVAQHNVPLYNQGDRNLCWAYSQTMIEDFKSGTTRTQEGADERAREIAISVHGAENWNQGGWPTNMGKTRSPSSIYSLYFMVRKGPIYGYYSNSNSAHLVVVTGVNVAKNEVYTNNPWGITGVQTFEEFEAGFAGGNSDMPLQFCIFVE